jgi:hypothetical protein
MVGNDKLFEILGRRTARNFASFVTHLPDSNSELAEDIIQYTRTHFQHIHRSIQNYQKEQSPPSATVRPSLATNSSSDTHSHITLDLVQGCRVTGNPTQLHPFISAITILIIPVRLLINHSYCAHTQRNLYKTIINTKTMLYLSFWKEFQKPKH